MEITKQKLEELLSSKNTSMYNYIVTDLIKDLRYYEMPPGLLKVVGVEIKQENTDGGLEFAPIRKISRSVLTIGDES